MRVPPDRPRDVSDESGADEIRRLLTSVVLRLRLRDGIRACACAAAGAALAIAAGRVGGVSASSSIALALLAAAICGGAVLVHGRAGRTRRAAAALIERRETTLRNVIVTAEELLARPDRTAPYMRTRVLADAGHRAGRIETRRIVPLVRPSALAVSAVLLLWIAFLVPRVGTARTSSANAGSQRRVSAPGDLTIDVQPPSYSGRPASRLRNPASIDAIAGSHAVITLSNVAAGIEPRVRMNGAEIRPRSAGDTRIAEAQLTESGYLAIDGEGVARRLIPVSVVPDRAPDVRIVAPARDLHVANASGAIDISATAEDDLGLASMEVRYTRISGAGEQFEFHEGVLATSVDRRSETDWRASARLSLAAMKLEPGDALVYRTIARDRRPGDQGLGTSDTYFVEIAGPGDVALAGLDMPPDRERYVLSQQMIVLKIERLRARESSMSKAAVQEAASSIEAEQRAVRVNFVFLLGGGVEDEEQEAETSTDILEGRFENKARQEILNATRLMSRAEQALAAASTSLALPPARAAAQALQRAFGHSRYLLRALPAKARIDPTRRLTGDRASAIDWLRGLALPADEPSVVAARDALSDLVSIASHLKSDPSSTVGRDLADALGSLAERVLRIEPASPDLLQSSKQLLAAREAVLNGQAANARAAIEASAGAIVTRAQRGRLSATPTSIDLGRLAGQLALEQERR
jgi:hypothetical protein